MSWYWIASIVVGSLAGYTFIAAMVSTLWPWSDSAEEAGFFWPLVGPVFLIYVSGKGIVCSGQWTARRMTQLRHRRVGRLRRSDLPMAKVHE